MQEIVVRCAQEKEMVAVTRRESRRISVRLQGARSADRSRDVAAVVFVDAKARWALRKVSVDRKLGEDGCKY